MTNTESLGAGEWEYYPTEMALVRHSEPEEEVYDFYAEVTQETGQALAVRFNNLERELSSLRETMGKKAARATELRLALLHANGPEEWLREVERFVTQWDEEFFALTSPEEVHQHEPSA